MKLFLISTRIGRPDESHFDVLYMPKRMLRHFFYETKRMFIKYRFLVNSNLVTILVAYDGSGF